MYALYNVSRTKMQVDRGRIAKVASAHESGNMEMAGLLWSLYTK